MIWLIYSFQVLVALAAIGIIMLQKAGDGIFSSSKIFGIRGRSSTVIRITYILGALFLINNVFLGIMYKKAHQAQMIKTCAKDIILDSSNSIKSSAKTKVDQVANTKNSDPKEKSKEQSTKSKEQKDQAPQKKRAKQ